MATATNPNAAFTILQNAGFPVVTVGSPPKINFTVLDNGAVVKGLTSANVSLGLAKLVKGTNGAPDQWVSYVYRTETATAGVGPGGAPVLATAKQPTTDTKSDPQLVYNSAGYYTYTFSTDITDPTKTNGVTYEPSLTHRVAIQLSYTNTAGATVRVNPTFDFTLSSSNTSQPVTDSKLTRKVVDVTSCNECHDKLALHGGGRIDTQYCVVCHNGGLTDANSGNVLDLRIMAHKIHAGEHAKEWFGTEYTIWGYRDTAHNYAEVRYPQPLQNCTKCHSASKTGADGKQLAAQGDNWKNVPSRAACGACHQGIDFATGKGLRIEDAENGLTTSQFGHVGGSQADDSKCALCHGPAAIETYHVTVDPKGSEGRGGYPVNTALNTPTAGYPAGQGPGIPLASADRVPEGVYKIDYEIKQASIIGAAGAKQAQVVYRVLK
ncbi:MAG TPA: OmcA/MtrC family decaheme c-type cytochrome, partial [Burkholderiales bacterium]